MKLTYNTPKASFSPVTEGEEDETWVRFEQIAYNFYEARMDGSIGMEEV